MERDPWRFDRVADPSVSISVAQRKPDGHLTLRVTWVSCGRGVQKEKETEVEGTSNGMISRAFVLCSKYSCIERTLARSNASSFSQGEKVKFSMDPATVSKVWLL